MAPPNDDPLTVRDREVFLRALSEGATKTAAAKAAGRALSSFARLAARDPGFAEQVRVAYHEEGRDALLANLDEVIADLRKQDPKSAMTGLFFLIKQRDPSFRENARLELEAGAVRPEVRVSVDFAGAFAALEEAGVVRRRPGVVDAEVGVGAGVAALLSASADIPADGGVDGAPVSAG